MEENKIMEREIVESSASLDDIGDGESSYYDEKTTRSKLSNWILNTGWSVGKKLVMTGVVMSFVPLVLPPLVLISALGCALSVPFGVVFASYVVTNKLMSKLLLPRPSNTQEYDRTALLQEEEKEEEQEQLVVDFEYQKEEEEEREAVMDAVDELTKDGCMSSLKEEKTSTHDDYRYPENIEVGEIIIITKEGERPQQIQNEKASSDLMDPQPHAANVDECAAAAPELRNTQDKKLDGDQNIIVGGPGEDVTMEIQTDKSAENDGGKKVADHKEEDDRFSHDKNEEVTVISMVTEDKKDSKGKSSSKEIKKPGKKARKREVSLKVDNIQEKLSGEEKGSGPKETDSSAIQEKSGPGLVVQETSRSELSSVASDTPNEGCIILGSGSNERKQVSGSNTSTDSLVSETRARVLGNEGVIDGTFEHRNVTICSDPGENYNQSKAKAGGGELKHDEKIPEAKEDKEKKVAAGDVDSDEGLFNAEKIWETMEAIRVIVGYKAPRSASYLEELKALYFFVGIEPPSDTAEFNNSLCLLMSVIGLK